MKEEKISLPRWY